MKKMLVLVLILVVAPMASALIKISVNGQQTFGDIIISPSDTLTLDIWNNEELTADNTIALAATALICPIACGTMTGDGVVNPLSGTTWDSSIAGVNLLLPPDGPIMPVGEGMSGVFVGITVFAGSIPIDQTLIDEIIFHCESANGPTLIQLVQLDATSGVPTGVVYDTITITQIPEPATMMLLSLGGLLLKKRRK